MSYNILTKIDREILRLDPEFASKRQLRDLAWARSSLKSTKPKEGGIFTSLLFALKEHVSALMMGEPVEKAPILETSKPQLKRPVTEEGSFRPPRYFSKGAQDRVKMAPIPYLLTETRELSQARPVPGKSLFLRSLAKGKGVLKKNDRGLFYLDIDNRFIMSLIPYLKAFGLIRPPYFNLFGSPDGAHIPVIPPRESAFHYLTTLPELDQEFTFEIEGLYSIEPTLWPEVEQVWFFKVRSPELEAIRQSQFLVATPGGHSFHIAVAVKPRTKHKSRSLPLPMMRINVAYTAA